MTVSLSTAGFWHHLGFEDSLRRIADAGYNAIELFCYPPHIHTEAFGRAERIRVQRLLQGLGLRCSSAATSADFNLLALHNGLHDLAVAELRRMIEIASDMEAPFVVLVGGRRHGLLPAPLDQSFDLMEREIVSLADHAERLGVKLALETVPFDILNTGKDVMDFVQRVDHPALGICYDCTNTLTREKPDVGVRDTAGKLLLVHVSDCWRDKWAHTAIGRGEIDFAAFARALSEIGYTGDAVYELMDGEDPSPRIVDGLQRLHTAGFAA